MFSGKLGGKRLTSRVRGWNSGLFGWTVGSKTSRPPPLIRRVCFASLSWSDQSPHLFQSSKTISTGMWARTSNHGQFKGERIDLRMWACDWWFFDRLRHSTCHEFHRNECHEYNTAKPGHHLRDGTWHINTGILMISSWLLEPTTMNIGIVSRNVSTESTLSLMLFIISYFHRIRKLYCMVCIFDYLYSFFAELKIHRQFK